MHSSKFIEPRKNAQEKKAVVIGCCNFGHDIARDYRNYGFDLTTVQRSSTLVLTSNSFHDVSLKGIYREDGVRLFDSMLKSTPASFSFGQPPVEDADIMNLSISNPIAKHLHIGTTNEMMQRDSTLLRGLTAAGFAIDSGPDGSGLMMKYLSKGDGYYINTGALQLIADDKIKIRQGHEVKVIKVIKVQSLVLNRRLGVRSR